MNDECSGSVLFLCERAVCMTPKGMGGLICDREPLLDSPGRWCFIVRGKVIYRTPRKTFCLTANFSRRNRHVRFTLDGETSPSLILYQRYTRPNYIYVCSNITLRAAKLCTVVFVYIHTNIIILVKHELG